MVSSVMQPINLYVNLRGSYRCLSLPRLANSGPCASTSLYADDLCSQDTLVLDSPGDEPLAPRVPIVFLRENLRKGFGQQSYVKTSARPLCPASIEIQVSA